MEKMSVSHHGQDPDSDTDDGRKRQRVSRACETCRNRKTKCDGTRPSCDTCLRLSSECRYLPGKKRGPVKGSHASSPVNKPRDMEFLLRAVMTQRQVEVVPPPHTNRNRGINVRQQRQFFEQQHQQHQQHQQQYQQHQQPHVQMQQLQLGSSVIEPDTDDGEDGDEDDDDISDDAQTPPPTNDDEQIGHSGVITRKTDGTSRYFGPSSGSYVLIFTAQVAVGRLMRQGLWPPPEDRRPPAWFGNPIGPPITPLNAPPLPPQLVNDLAVAYCTHWHDLLPVLLDQNAFLASLQSPNLADRPPQALIDALAASAATINGAYGTALTEFLGSQSISTASEALMGRASCELVYAADRPEPSCIQAHMLLYITTARVGRSQRGWLHVSQAVRLAQELGLHPNNATPISLPPIERLMRARLWWLCIIMDAHLAMTVGRPMAIDQQDAEATLDHIVALQTRLRVRSPAPATHLPNPAQISVGAPGPNIRRTEINARNSPDEDLLTDNDLYLIALVSLCVLQGRILRLLNGQAQPTSPQELINAVKYHDESLVTWRASLPSLLNDPYSSATAMKLHITFHSTRIVLLRACIPLRRRRYSSTSVDPQIVNAVIAGQAALAKCIDAADTIFTITENSSPSDPAQQHPFYIHHISQACSVQLIRFLWDENGLDTPRAHEDLTRGVRALRNLSIYSPSANRAAGWFMGIARLLGIPIPVDEWAWTAAVDSKPQVAREEVPVGAHLTNRLATIGAAALSSYQGESNATPLSTPSSASSANISADTPIPVYSSPGEMGGPLEMDDWESLFGRGVWDAGPINTSFDFSNFM